MPTEHRIQRIARSLHRRQSDLIIALDRVHDRHNLSAVLRSADAVGISEVIWMPDYNLSGAVNPEVAQGAERWVKVRRIKSLSGEITSLKKQGFGVAATHLGKQAVDFRTVDWNKPWVVVMGNERRGCSDEILALADVKIYIPMMGLIQSLNISVATAVTLYEIQRCRENSGRYSQTQPREVVERFYAEWNLAGEGISVEELLKPVLNEGNEERGEEHVDGRTQFAAKLRAKKAASSKGQERNQE